VDCVAFGLQKAKIYSIKLDKGAEP